MGGSEKYPPHRKYSPFFIPSPFVGMLSCTIVSLPLSWIEPLNSALDSGLDWTGLPPRIRLDPLDSGLWFWFLDLFFVGIGGFYISFFGMSSLLVFDLLSFVGLALMSGYGV